ncbi:MAG: uracil-DNA glycosylase [Proteobacteria bacterium]|nr:uracil-DNA glycosylase [Pseudomonadota bacterium]
MQHQKMQRKTDCHRCRHYYVTYDKDFPYGCKAMGFKSRQNPYIVVRNSSEHECLSMEPKKERLPPVNPESIPKILH